MTPVTAPHADRLSNKVRLLQLPHGGVAAVPTDAYSVSLRSLARPPPAAAREAARNAIRDGPATAERFLSLVLPRHTGFGLTRAELAEALGPRHAAADLEALLDWGALTRHPTAQTASYIFGLPDAGRYLRSVVEGRLVSQHVFWGGDDEMTVPQSPAVGPQDHGRPATPRNTPLKLERVRSHRRRSC